MLPLPPVPQAHPARLEKALRDGGPRRRLRARRLRVLGARRAEDHRRRVREAYAAVMGEVLARLIVELADLEVRYAGDPSSREDARREAFTRAAAMRARTFATARAHLG